MNFLELYSWYKEDGRVLFDEYRQMDCSEEIKLKHFNPLDVKRFLAIGSCCRTLSYKLNCDCDFTWTEDVFVKYYELFYNSTDGMRLEGYIDRYKISMIELQLFSSIIDFRELKSYTFE